MASINVDHFIKSLGYMAKGMGGIFIVTAIIILSVFILAKVTDKKSGK